MDFVTASTGLISPYWMGLPIRYIHRECGYEILDISQLIKTYKDSCELRFIRNWKLDKLYVAQFEDVTFEVDGQTFEFTNEMDEDDWY